MENDFVKGDFVRDNVDSLLKLEKKDKMLKYGLSIVYILLIIGSLAVI